MRLESFDHVAAVHSEQCISNAPHTHTHTPSSSSSQSSTFLSINSDFTTICGVLAFFDRDFSIHYNEPFQK